TVPARIDGEAAYVSGRVEWCPQFDLIQMEDAGAIDAHPGIERGDVYVWAWIDEGEGLIRARCFAPDAGIAEDEATGSAALRLASKLGREIEVRQGRGSVIHARPLADGMVEIGGLVVEE
ncbi:MAG: PhzF family phenazine biosynthesis protein, partial [Solirubrobacterales bacterium]|nr:PhzF family phenazine biosynthesis protein [Solirubrobacterales bacterium]